MTPATTTATATTTITTVIAAALFSQITEFKFRIKQ